MMFQTIWKKKSALDMYFEDPKLNMRNHPNLNVLHYWKENIYHFGILTYMAMVVLATITTVNSESSFSIRFHVIRKYQSRFLLSDVKLFFVFVLGYMVTYLMIKV